MDKFIRIRFLLAIAAFLTTNGNAWAQPSTLSVQDALSRALSGSPEVLEAKAALKSAEINRKLSYSPFLPQIALEAGTLQREPTPENQSGEFFYGVGRWNIFRGGSDRALLRISQIEEEKERRQFELAKARVSRQVIRRFAAVLYIDESIRLSRETLEVNRGQLKIAKRKASGGLTSNADILEFEFRENALNTQVELLKHDRRVAARALSISLGDDPQSEVQLTGKLDLSLAELAERSFGTADFIRQTASLDAETDLEIANLRHRAAWATWLPRADVEGRYGNMKNAEPEVRGTPGWLLELKFTMPIFSGTETIYARQAAATQRKEREAQLRQARLNQSAISADQTEKMKVLEVLLQLQKENMARAERYYNATLAEYKRGIKNSPDLSGATERLFEARLRDLALNKDMIMSRIGLIDADELEILDGQAPGRGNP